MLIKYFNNSMEDEFHNSKNNMLNIIIIPNNKNTFNTIKNNIKLDKVDDLNNIIKNIIKYNCKINDNYNLTFHETNNILNFQFESKNNKILININHKYIGGSIFLRILEIILDTKKKYLLKIII